MSRVFEKAVMGPAGFAEVAASEVAAHKGDVLIIDVRENNEWNGDLGHIEGAKLLPLSGWPAAARNVEAGKAVVMVCRSGKRSAQAALQLAKAGGREVYNLSGGMMAWSQAGLPVSRS